MLISVYASNYVLRFNSRREANGSDGKCVSLLLSGHIVLDQPPSPGRL